MKAEHLKYGQIPALVKHLAVFLTIIWTILKVPAVWLVALVTCLHKKGPKSQPENYRGISIISTLSGLGVVVES